MAAQSEKPHGFLAMVSCHSQMYVPWFTEYAGQSLGKVPSACGGASEIDWVANHGANWKKAKNATTAATV